MDDQQDGNPPVVEVVEYSSPWAPVSVFVSIVFIVVCTLVLVEMLIGSIEATLYGKVFVVILILYPGSGIFLAPLAIGTIDRGILLKYYPGWFRVIPWTEVRKLVRYGAVGQSIYISRHRFFDLWPVTVYIPPLAGSRQLELIDRLIAVICQQARLTPKRKTLRGYDVYIRDDG